MKAQFSIQKKKIEACSSPSVPHYQQQRVEEQMLAGNFTMMHDGAEHRLAFCHIWGLQVMTEADIFQGKYKQERIFPCLVNQAYSSLTSEGAAGSSHMSSNVDDKR